MHDLVNNNEDVQFISATVRYCLTFARTKYICRCDAVCAQHNNSDDDQPDHHYHNGRVTHTTCTEALILLVICEPGRLRGGPVYLFIC